MTEKSPEAWPPKAYKNLDFLNSPEARKIRILCELEETEKRFRDENIEDTIVMFYSDNGTHKSITARLNGQEV